MWVSSGSCDGPVLGKERDGRAAAGKRAPCRPVFRMMRRMAAPGFPPGTVFFLSVLEEPWMGMRNKIIANVLLTIAGEILLPVLRNFVEGM